MKFNLAYPIQGTQKMVEIDDDKKCSIFYDKRMGQEVAIDGLGDEYHGYIVKIGGGNDKDGFPMKQGVLVKGRVRLLMRMKTSCYRPRRTGERKRKSVRGCIIGPDIRALHLVIVKKGDKEIEGLTDKSHPRRLGPKRATKIRRLFAIPKANKTDIKKEDETTLIKKNVVRRTWTAASGKQRQKAPKIQRLVTDVRLRRKRIYKKQKLERYQKSTQGLKDYNKFAAEWRRVQLEKKQAKLALLKAQQSDEGRLASGVAKKPVAAQKSTGTQKAPAPSKGSVPQKPATAQKQAGIQQASAPSKAVAPQKASKK